jgi:hypothetical protein
MAKNYRTKSTIPGPFAWRTIEMMESPAFRVLSHSARRIIDRLEIELAHHAGTDNGKLPCTFDHFAEYGIDRHSIAPALRELAALKFIEITEHGRAGNAEYRRPNLFRLNYRHVDRAMATDEWRTIKTEVEARMLAKTARKAAEPKHSPVGEFTKSQRGNPHRKPQIHSGKTPTKAIVEKPPLPLYLGNQAYEGKGSRKYTLSSDPRAYEQFGTIEYRGRPFLIVNNDVRKKLALSRRAGNGGRRGLRAA